ncbi:MAG TPA: hypothetical protein VMU51_26950 [Mycobacteriales bacterium]|nr:hypothetical protein [Mycobacteriales bacterium]
MPISLASPAYRHGVLRRRRLLAALAATLLVGVGALVAAQLLPQRYAATSVVSFVPRPNSLASADTVQLVGQKYVVVATSPVTLAAAGSRVGAPVGLLTDATTAVLGAGTGNVAVTVTLPDRSDAVEAANAVAGELVRAAQSDRLVQGEQTAAAVPATAELRPPRLLLRSVAVLAALLAGLLVWTALAGLTRPGEVLSDGVTVAIR